MAALVLKIRKLAHFDGRNSPLSYYRVGSSGPRTAARHGWQVVSERVVVDHTDPVPSVPNDVATWTMGVPNPRRIPTAVGY